MLHDSYAHLAVDRGFASSWWLDYILSDEVSYAAKREVSIAKSHDRGLAMTDASILVPANIDCQYLLHESHNTL